MLSIKRAVLVSAAFLLTITCGTFQTAHGYDYGNYQGYNTRKFTKPGLKCAGAPGKPYVVYAPCTDGYTCRKKVTYRPGEWGLYCLPRNATSSKGNLCYRAKQRCAGAPGKPFVQYYPCCSKRYECAKAPDIGWGKFCVPTRGRDKVSKGDDAPASYSQDTRTNPQTAAPTSGSGGSYGYKGYSWWGSWHRHGSGHGPHPTTATPTTQTTRHAAPRDHGQAYGRGHGYGYGYGYGYGRPRTTRGPSTSKDARSFCIPSKVIVPVVEHKVVTGDNPGVIITFVFTRSLCGEHLSAATVSKESIDALQNAVCTKELSAALVARGATVTRCAVVAIKDAVKGVHVVVEVATTCRPSSLSLKFSLSGFPPRASTKVDTVGQPVCPAPSPDN